MSERIRWVKDTTDHPGYENIPEWTGTVRDIYLFLIAKPALDGDGYTLSTELPWQHKRRARDLNPDLLKAEAERWLEEFTASIGAIFPDAALAYHQPITRRQGWNPTCSYDNHSWPCPEVAAITAELTGKGGSDGG